MRGREKQTTTAIGKAFKVLRRQRKMSAFSVGLEIGMSYDTIYDWENGKREMMMGNFLAVCRVIGVKPSEVLRIAEGVAQ